MPPAGNWVRFACSIPPIFVLSYSLPRVNTMGKLALFGRFSITAGSLPSRLTDHYSLATRFTSHVPRPTIVGVRRRCRAPSWVQHSPPGRRQHAMKSYVFGFSAEVWRAWFSAQLNIEMGLTFISLLTLVGRDARPNCLPKKELRRYEPRSRFPKNRLFDSISGRLTPSGQQISAESGMGYPLVGTRETWVVPTVPLATVFPSHAPRFTPR